MSESRQGECVRKFSVAVASNAPPVLTECDCADFIPSAKLMICFRCGHSVEFHLGVTAKSLKRTTDEA